MDLPRANGASSRGCRGLEPCADTRPAPDLGGGARWRRGLPASVVNDPAVAIVVAYDDDRIAAGAIGNRSASVVGVSNLFTVTADEHQAWAGAVATISAHFPGMPLVGYENAAGLLAAHRAGFITVGPLRVWLKD